MSLTGGCHCGRVRFEVDGAPEKLIFCNCSICHKKAYLHWIVPRDRFRLLSGAEDLATYTFNTGAAKHHFCRTCGVAPYYIARSDPDAIDVNARCVDDLDLEALPLQTFDGVNWEASYERYRR